jgi:hypothetical protein
MILRIFVCLCVLAVYAASAGLFLSADDKVNEQMEQAIHPKVEYKADELRDPFRIPPALISQEMDISLPAKTAEENKRIPSLRLQGVIWGGSIPLVIIKDKILKIGDTIEDCRILEINKDGVVIFYIDKKYTLPLPGILKGGTDEKDN